MNERFYSIGLLFILSFVFVNSWITTTNQYLQLPVDGYNDTSLVKKNITKRDNAYTIYKIEYGPTIFRIWQPHRDDNVVILIEASVNWLLSHPEYSIEIRYVGFNGASSYPIDKGAVDVLILGNAHVMGRYGRGDIIDLTSYIQQYQATTGDIITNDFGRFCYLEGSFNGRWGALPLMSSTLLLYFNRTVYDVLNMTYPPPFANWAPGTWTWKAFVNQLQTIRAAQGPDKGFHFPASCGNIAEWQLFAMVAQSYHTEILDSGGNSNLNRPGPKGDRLRQAFEEIIMPIFLYNGTYPLGDWLIPSNITDKNYAPANLDMNVVTSDTHDYIHPEDDNTIGCWTSSNLKLLSGFAILGAGKWSSYIKDMGQLWINPSTPNYTDSKGNNFTRNYGLAFMPGQTSYLGGSYIAIPTNSTNQDTAWDFIINLVNRSNPWLGLYANNQGTPPPYESAWKNSPIWTSPDQITLSNTFAKAVPPTYPLASFPEWPDLESRFFMRYFLIDLVYKRLSYESASMRTNALIADVFMPLCSTENNLKVSVQPQCNNDMTRRVDFLLANTTCKGTVTLPESRYIRCEYIPKDSSVGSTFTVLSSFGIILSVFGAFFLVIFRMKPAVRASFWPFGLIFSLGCAFCFACVLVSVGVSTPSNQALQPIFLALGFVCIFGTFVMKLYRLDRIFSADTTRASKNRITDYHMFMGLGGIFFCELVVLGIFFWIGPPQEIYYRTEVSTQSTDIVMAETKGWKVGEGIGTAVLLIFNFTILLLGLIASIRLRNIPSNFKENQFNLVTITVVSLDILIIFPLTALQIDHLNAIVIFGFGILFATFAIWGTYFIPKIFFVVKNIQVSMQEQTGATHEDVVTHRKYLAILRAHLTPLFISSGANAKKAPELYLDEVITQLQIPCDDSDLMNMETRTELMALWCLPPPVTTLTAASPSKGGSSHRSIERNENSKNQSVGSRRAAESDPMSESKNPLVGSVELEMETIKEGERTAAPTVSATTDGGVDLGDVTGDHTSDIIINPDGETEMSKSNLA